MNKHWYFSALMVLVLLVTFLPEVRGVVRASPVLIPSSAIQSHNSLLSEGLPCPEMPPVTDIDGYVRIIRRR